MAQYIETFPTIAAALASGGQDHPWTDVWRQRWGVTSSGVASPFGSDRSTGDYSRLEAPTDTNNMRVSANVRFIGAPQHTTNVVAVCARMPTGSTAGGYMAVLSGLGQLQIARIDGNSATFTTLVQASDTVDVASPGVLALTVNGSMLSATWNGVLAAQVTDASVPSGTLAGLYGYERSATVYVEVTQFSVEDTDVNPEPQPSAGRVFVIDENSVPQPAIITRA